MFRPCAYCGDPPPEQGHGISRLRNTDATAGPQVMGPYSKANTTTACAHCNLAKGYHKPIAFTEICRHICTHQGLGDFGSFPDRFAKNISKKSRSCYLADTKTHSLTNEQFREIVNKPCYYCGKPTADGHYNGLDRLDSTVRVYNAGSCVSCCGTCNVMKYRWSVQEFLDHCLRVAIFAASNEAVTPSADGAKFEDAESAEQALNE